MDRGHFETARLWPSRCVILWLMLLVIPGGIVIAQPVGSPTPADQQSVGQTNLAEALAEARQEWHDRLNTLAQTCQRQGLDDAAARIRSKIVVRDPQRQYIFLPPPGGLQLPDDAPAAEKARHDEFRKINQSHANRLIHLARFAMGRTPAAAYQLLHEALVAAPDDRELRRILGYRQGPDDQWVKTSRPVISARGRTRQKVAGWEKNTYYVIQSPHFRICAIDEQAGLQLAGHLERTHDVWRQVWFEYWSSARQLESWVNGQGRPGSGSQRHDVLLFRDADQYRQAVASHVAPGEVDAAQQSIGFYAEGDRTSFFYNDSPPPLATWRHEIVHQLLQEHAGSKRSVADYGHAWLVEAIAMYFESLNDHGPWVTLGGFDADRLQYARLRFTREGFFVPLAELDSLNRAELQQSSDIRAMYSQSAGLGQFLFVGEDTRYRDPLIRFVKEFYQGRGGDNGLAKALGPLDQIDRQYRQFLKVERDQLKSIPAGGQTGLALAQSGIRSEDLTGLSRCQSLEWLQLSENPVDDDGLKHLTGLPHLTRLMIDVTGITDDGLKTLVPMKALEQLDVANTRISDAGLESIGQLPALQVLWLSGTAITDAGLQHLESLKHLRYLDVRQTAITDAAIARLQEKLPELEIAR